MDSVSANLWGYYQNVWTDAGILMYNHTFSFSSRIYSWIHHVAKSLRSPLCCVGLFKNEKRIHQIPGVEALADATDSGYLSMLVGRWHPEWLASLTVLITNHQLLWKCLQYTGGPASISTEDRRCSCRLSVATTFTSDQCLLCSNQVMPANGAGIWRTIIEGHE